jgi:hypothetical protein
MTRQAAFLMLLTGSTLYALIRGGRPEQIGAATLFGGAWLSVLVVQPLGLRFRHLETGILMTDMVILGIFLWLSIRSTRFWPIWIAALLGAEVLVHLATMVAPRAGWEAYMAGTMMWSWGAQTLLIAATWRHRCRVARTGADTPWKS